MVAILFCTTNLDSDMWGVGKGSPLTAEEVDENFFNLKTAVEALEENPIEPLQIQSIVALTGANAGLMRITLSNGTTTYDVQMPEAAFTFRGTYDEIMAETDPAIAIYDFFTADEGLYMALQAQDVPATEFGAADGNEQGPFYKLIMPYITGADVGFFMPGVPGRGIVDGEAMFAYTFTRDAYIPDNAEGSVARLRFAPTVARTWPIYKDDTEIGNVFFDVGATEGVITFPAPVQFSFGETLRVVKMVDSETESASESESEGLDETARDFSLSFAMTKGIFA